MDWTFWQPRRSRFTEGRWLAVMGLAGAGIGAGLMYLFDPVGGGRRRALVRDRMNKWVRQTGDAVDGQSRHVMNRARGLGAELRSRLGRTEQAERESAERVSWPPEARSF